MGRYAGRCPPLSRAPLSKSRVEADIWADVNHYIHHPDEAHALVAAQLGENADAGATLRAKLAEKQQELDAKQEERDRILTFYHTGHMTERDLARQLDTISQGQAKLEVEVAKLTRDLSAASDMAARLAGTDALLAELAAQYDAELLTPERQRSILEQFVDEMMVRTETNPETGKPRAVVRVRYRFEPAESTAGD
jgi:chromosome segregation ATPase